MFERSTVKVLGNRMKERRKFIQVLMGPRQVGKTTLVIQPAIVQVAEEAPRPANKPIKLNK